MTTDLATKPSLSLSVVDWAVIAVYSLTMVGMGLYLSRAATKSADGFLIGERSLPWWVIGFSNASTYSDSGGIWVWIFFVGGFMYLNQIAWIAWPIWMPLVGVFWAKMWRRSRLVTTGELLEFRYSGKAAARFRSVYGIYVCGCWATIFLGYGLSLVSQILAPLIGWEPLTIILVFGGIATAYTILGGLLSAAYVDVPQFFIFFIAAFVLLFFGVQEFGSYREILTQAMANRDADFWQILPPSSGTNTYVDPRTLFAIVLIGLFLAGSPAAGEGWTAQRCLAARNEQHAVLGQMFSSVLSLVIRMAPLLPLGILAIALYPTADPGRNSTAHLANGVETSSVTVWSQLVVRYSDRLPGFGGLMISAVLAGFMSTVGTQLQWGSSFVVNDFYRRHLRPEAPEREYILVSRLIMLAMMIAATVLAMGISNVSPWVLFINAAMIAPALPLSWLRWFWWRFNIWGELFGLVISLPLACYIWFGLGASAWPFWQPTLLLLGIGLVGSVLVALATPAESSDTLRRFYLQIRPPGAWGAIRNQLAREGLVDFHQLRRELRWDLVASVCGIVFCFTMVYSFFMAVVMQWKNAALFAAAALVSGSAFFVSWLRSARTSKLADEPLPVIAAASATAATQSCEYFFGYWINRMTQISALALNHGMASKTKSPFENPFDGALDADRHEIWQALVARDSEAFAAVEWSICCDDFAADRFEGISAHGYLDPLAWSLCYPTVQSYRDDWIRMAREYLSVPLADISHRELLYQMQTLARIELAGDRAIVWKQFIADERLRDGGRHRVSSQSVYRLHRINDRWLIVGFVGYLPLEQGNELG